MSFFRGVEQKALLSNVKGRFLSGHVDRRAFLRLAAALGVGAAAALRRVDRAGADSVVRFPLRDLKKSYDYIIVGAGSAGCVTAARLAADGKHQVLLLEAGGTDIDRPALTSPLAWASNLGTDVDWKYSTSPQ